MWSVVQTEEIWSIVYTEDIWSVVYTEMAWTSVHNETVMNDQGYIQLQPKSEDTYETELYHIILKMNIQ